MTLRAVADQIGLRSERALSAWERNEKTPKEQYTPKNCRISWLLSPGLVLLASSKVNWEVPLSVTLPDPFCRMVDTPTRRREYSSIAKITFINFVILRR